MSNNKSKKTIISISFIILLIIIRFIIQNSTYENFIVALINFFGMSFVLFGIYISINTYLNSCAKANKLFLKQYNTFKRHKNYIIIILLLIIAIYSFLLFNNKDIVKLAGCINDTIALVTLGFSIEDESIIEKLKNYYHYL